jgi:hypothetical protein
MYEELLSDLSMGDDRYRVVVDFFENLGFLKARVHSKFLGFLALCPDFYKEANA